MPKSQEVSMLLHNIFLKENVWISIQLHGYHFDGLVQDCSISIANAMEILQYCTKPSNWRPVDN